MLNYSKTKRAEAEVHGSVSLSGSGTTENEITDRLGIRWALQQNNKSSLNDSSLLNITGDTAESAGTIEVDVQLQNKGVVNNGNAGFIAASVDGIRFYSCYAPLNLTIIDFIDFLDRLTEDAKQYYSVPIAGDFNAWTVDWGSKLTNARGKVLEAFLTLDVVLLNSGNTPTYTKGDASSIVNLTFVSSSLIRGNYDWRVMDLYTASEHNSILWEVSIDQNPRRPAKKLDVTGWKMKSFDPSPGLQHLQSCMPRKRGMNQRPPVHWWNDHITLLRKECPKKRRISQRGCRWPNSAELVAEYKSTRRCLNKAIKDSKKNC
ncbi:hypothetical protein EVAR_78886_1 [Eumeta japonica]|uniref:Endonuclease/exonuclease/phosphatase domain-containing protein n=1 Tax=Eumeta variegata TaxID=151549 RepID=A0A4C1U2K4_EUMVA|nr:hypothetical protein EVAR_78886_1 [Eumeta japonica]